MQEVTTFKDGDLKVEFDGKTLKVYLGTYTEKSYSSLNDAIRELGSLLGMATKAVAVGKERIVEDSKDTDKPTDLSGIPF